MHLYKTVLPQDGLDLKHVCFAILSNWLEVLLAVFLFAILIGGVPLLWYGLLALLGVLTVRELLQGIQLFDRSSHINITVTLPEFFLRYW